jgi:GNAT superfamily N-acetyltransferase
VGRQPARVVDLARRHHDPHRARIARTAAPIVRPARARDLPRLAAIEDSGLALFAAALGDLSGSALSAPAEPGERRAERPGFLLVAGDEPVGFAHVRLLDGHAHLDQLSVRPDHGRRGIGTALVEAACERAAAAGHGQITLMTYADLPWNAPFYARLGFAEVPEDEPRASYQVELAAAEERLGLGTHGRRVLMRRVLRRHRTTDELSAFLPALDRAPRDEGVLRLVVRRPAVGEREVLESGRLDPRVGLVGDTWTGRGSRRTPDGSPHPDMQLNVMSHALAEFLAGDPERVPLAGDQLFLDLELSEDNLPPGTRLALGDPGRRGAVIEVTEQPHAGCGKFVARYGRDAMRFVMSREGRSRRLRGLCARVVEAGEVRPGDPVRVIRPTPGG